MTERLLKIRAHRRRQSPSELCRKAAKSHRRGNIATVEEMDILFAGARIDEYYTPFGVISLKQHRMNP